MNYYNEWDRHAAAWLRELIKEGHIPKGVVDERSITEVSPEDLKGFTQCHFFAGVGGWSYALRFAGIPDDFPCWTGSPPCQPFSTAGKQLGHLDERHLAPTFMRLVDQCRPTILFGEQVAAAIGKHWLDDLFVELERQGYACGSAVLPACSVGAPHKRDRLFFGAVNQLVDTNSKRPQGEWANSNSQRREGSDVRQVGLCDGAGNCSRTLAYTNDHRQSASEGGRESSRNKEGDYTGWGCSHSFWSNPDWLGCRDGKFRPVEPGTFPLANGIPARVGRLRGYGNAIVPQVAAEFILGFLDASTEVSQKN